MTKLEQAIKDLESNAKFIKIVPYSKRPEAEIKAEVEKRRKQKEKEAAWTKEWFSNYKKTLKAQGWE